VHQQLRGDLREWLGTQMLIFERMLAAAQDHLVVQPAQRKFDEYLNRIERDCVLVGGD
jgi:molecular chaperone HscC